MTPPTDAQWTAMSKVLQSMIQRSDTGAYCIFKSIVCSLEVFCIRYTSITIITHYHYHQHLFVFAENHCYALLSHSTFNICVIRSLSLTTEPFRVPVDWKGMGLFDYPTLIKKPMDLGSVKRNINARKYKSIPEAAGKSCNWFLCCVFLLMIYVFIFRGFGCFGCVNPWKQTGFCKFILRSGRIHRQQSHPFFLLFCVGWNYVQLFPCPSFLNK